MSGNEHRKSIDRHPKSPAKKLVGALNPSEKYESQLGNKNHVPNHQREKVLDQISRERKTRNFDEARNLNLCHFDSKNETAKIMGGSRENIGKL